MSEVGKLKFKDQDRKVGVELRESRVDMKEPELSTTSHKFRDTQIPKWREFIQIRHSNRQQCPARR